MESRKQTDKIIGGQMDKISYRVDVQWSYKSENEKDINRKTAWNDILDRYSIFIMSYAA